MMLHMEYLFILMNVILVAVAKEPLSPACSRYDFEEKLLERVLRNELAIETMLKEIRETNVNVKSTLDALDKSKNDMESKLNNAISSGMTQISEAVSDLTQNASITISQMQKETAVLKDQLSIPTVYFNVHSPADHSLDSGQDVVYTDIRVNEGQGYDKKTGRFTVSIPGLYAFTIQYCALTSSYAHLQILRNWTQIHTSYFYSSNSYQCVSMQAFVKLALSMNIWVQSMGASNLASIGNLNSFAGVLLHL